MSVKLYWVTSSERVDKKHTKSREIGFVSVFGWESAPDKAVKKYPGFGNYQLHEMRRRWRTK